MDYEALEFEIRSGVAHLTLNRPKAANALDLTMVRELVDVADGELMAEAEALAKQLASGPTRAYGGVKKLMVASATNDLETQMDLETDFISGMTETKDGIEGMNAFLEKRAANFTGE